MLLAWKCSVRWTGPLWALQSYDRIIILKKKKNQKTLIDIDHKF